MSSKSAKVANAGSFSPRKVSMKSSFRLSRKASSARIDNATSFSQREPLFFQLLSEDIQLDILSYLDVKSIQSWIQVSNAAREIALNAEDAITVLWKPACERQWPWLQEQIESTSEFVKDALNVLPLHNTDKKGIHVNLPLLLSLAAKHKSTTIDESLFVPTRWSRMRRRHRPIARNVPQDLRFVTLQPKNLLRHQESSGTAATASTDRTNTTASDDTNMCDKTNTIHAVQFIGAVGGRNRSIRADQPLPCPQESVTVAKMIAYEKKQKSFWRKYFHRKHGLEEDELAADVQMWKPFVAPFAVQDFDATTVHLTPRLISYFEVTIMEPVPHDQDEDHDQPQHQQQQHQRQQQQQPSISSDCVVVGIATDDFPLVGRLPGWDTRSYGYHGDDGGIYHGSGEMNKRFGPTFGVGDTIGCGIDYHHRGIFYTKNGRFLGYAFENLSFWTLNNQWFPVIGMDTTCLVACNFGTQHPFQFNLNRMVRDRQQKIITNSIVPKQHQGQDNKNSKKSRRKKAFKLLSW